MKEHELCKLAASNDGTHRYERIPFGFYHVYGIYGASGRWLYNVPTEADAIAAIAKLEKKHNKRRKKGSLSNG